MARPFSSLRKAMYVNDIQQQDLTRYLLLGVCAINQRFCGKKPWRLNEMYIMMDLLHLPYDQMHVFFPRNGQNEPGCNRDRGK